MRGAIIDLDGTVYIGGQVLEGTGDGIASLRDAGMDVLYFSNNPVMGGQTYVEHLQTMGVDARAGEALSAGDVTAETLAEQHPDDTIFLIGSDGLREQLSARDLTLTEDPAIADIILASWSADFDYDDMRRALVAVDEDTPFYGTDPDPTFQMSGDELVPGSGAIIGSVAATIEREPDTIFGKPSLPAQRLALDRMDIPPEDCLIVGDRLETDLEMGRQTGMTTVLVCSGVSDPDDIDDSRVTPDYCIADLGELDAVLSDMGV